MQMVFDGSWFGAYERKAADRQKTALTIVSP